MNGIIYKNILFLFIYLSALNAQQIEPNKYGLAVVDNINTYKALVHEDSSKLFVDLEKFIPGIILDIRYATNNNFIGEPVYNISKAFARLPVALALRKIQSELKSNNIGLKIFDAYRPYSVTVKFYEKVSDPEFVATPQKGSRHNRGCAVDLTLANLSTGKELVMPTGYDDFTEKASQNFNDLSEEQLKNREMLKKAMTENGFIIYSSEWWHYDFEGWEKFELMDISFTALTDLDKENK